MDTNIGPDHDHKNQAIVAIMAILSILSILAIRARHIMVLNKVDISVYAKNKENCDNVDQWWKWKSKYAATKTIWLKRVNSEIRSILFVFLPYLLAWECPF